jgi:exodeoxyribonuclease-3
VKIATWNINSVRMRIKYLREFLIETNPDIVLLQEIKCETDKFPVNELSDLPYNIYVHGQKSYNGVAILSKFPADEIVKYFPEIDCTDQSRIIEISLQTPIGYCNIISLYAPNGSLVNSDKFKMKLDFYDQLTDYLKLKKSLNREKLVIIAGDFNIAPFDIDVYSAKELQNSTCFTKEERQKFRIILNTGFDDLYRLANPDKQEFSWWDYRAGSFEQNKGMRIDMILASSNVTNRLNNCNMSLNWRAKEKASDHIPVIAEFF